MKRTVFALLIAVGLTGGNGLLQAGDKTPAAKAEGHLGLSVATVPPVLHSQLGGTLAKGQGVLVGQVAKDSPAAHAGLQANDILLSFGDQKLYSPEQLVKLVRAAAPGHTVAMEFLRGGKTMNCKVTLGQAEHATDAEAPRVFRVFPDEQFRKMFEGIDSKHDDSAWEMFDAMKLTRIDAKHWRAEIEYRSKDGKKDTKAFTGTRAEIRKAIQGEKDLPAEERSHLLRALNLHDPIFEFHFPALGATPPGLPDHP